MPCSWRIKPTKRKCYFISILYYIIKDVVIPVGSTLKLESDELDYDASVFNLYVKLGGSTPVDVIVR